jgi:hypothetical protein
MSIVCRILWDQRGLPMVMNSEKRTSAYFDVQYSLLKGMRSCDVCELTIRIRPLVFCNCGTAKLRSGDMSASHITESMITLTELNCTSRECSLRPSPTTWSGPRLRQLMVMARASQRVCLEPYSTKYERKRTRCR